MVPRLPRRPRGSLRPARALPNPASLTLMAHFLLVVFLGSALAGGSTATNRPHAEEPDALENAVPLVWSRAARPLLHRRALRRHRDRLLRLVGARRRLARPPRLGRHRLPASPGSSASGRSSTASSTPTSSTAPSTKAAKKSPPAAACWRACKPAACKPTCASLRWPSSRWPQFSSGAAGHERNHPIT